MDLQAGRFRLSAASSSNTLLVEARRRFGLTRHHRFRTLRRLMVFQRPKYPAPIASKLLECLAMGEGSKPAQALPRAPMALWMAAETVLAQSRLTMRPRGTAWFDAAA